MRRAALAKPRADGQVIGRQLVKLKDAVFKRSLPDQTFGLIKGLPGAVLASQAISRHAAQVAVVFALVQRTDSNSKVTRQKLQHIAAYRFNTLLTNGLFGQLPLPGAQPGLLVKQFCAVVLLLHGITVGIGQAL